MPHKLTNVQWIDLAFAELHQRGFTDQRARDYAHSLFESYGETHTPSAAVAEDASYANDL